MNRQGTNRKKIKSPGLIGAKRDIVRTLAEKDPWAFAIAKKNPYLIKATYAATIEAIRNYRHQKDKQTRKDANLRKGTERKSGYNPPMSEKLRRRAG